MRVFASTCSAVSPPVEKVACVARSVNSTTSLASRSGSRFETGPDPRLQHPAASAYFPQRQAEPHLQLVQVQVGLQRPFCSVWWVISLLLCSCCEEAQIGAGEHAILNGTAKFESASSPASRRCA